MIVVDASAVLDLLLRTEDSAGLEERILNDETALTAPELIDLEVAQVLRRLSTSKNIKDSRANEALDDFMSLSIEKYSHELFLYDIWSLRKNFTAYDASYVALAQALDCPLVTRDKKLASQAHKRIRVELI